VTNDHVRIKTVDIPTIRKKLLRKQKGICPICGRTVSDPVLDHDHKSEAVRDTLCRACNSLEGRIKHWCRLVPNVDDVTLVRRLARYWIKHETNRHGLLHPGRKKRRRKRKK